MIDFQPSLSKRTHSLSLTHKQAHTHTEQKTPIFHIRFTAQQQQQQQQQQQYFAITNIKATDEQVMIIFNRLLLSIQKS